MSAAARVGDPIEHTSALEGLLLGLAVGAAAVVVGLAAGVTILATGGLAAVAAVGAVMALSAGFGELIGSLSWCTNKAGQIFKGSGNVFTNGKPAARAHVDTATCDKHGSVPQVIAQGSRTVHINGQPAARVGDRTVCDGKISAGSGNVNIGGATEQTDDINPEVEPWLHWLVGGIGFGSAVVLTSPLIAITAFIDGAIGGVIGSVLGGRLFGEDSDEQKVMAFSGALIGGWFGARYEVKTQGFGSNLANVKIQRRGASVGEPEKVPTYKVPHSPVTKAQRADLKAKLENRTLTREEYKRLDWDRRFANKRAKGVSRFWADERAKLKLDEPGTRNWSADQQADILANKTPKFNGESIQGHHKYNALDHPQLASDPKNIYPATRTEHFERWHGGSWRNDSFGEPLKYSYPEEF